MTSMRSVAATGKRHWEGAAQRLRHEVFLELPSDIQRLLGTSAGGRTAVSRLVALANWVTAGVNELDRTKRREIYDQVCLKVVNLMRQAHRH